MGALGGAGKSGKNFLVSTTYSTRPAHGQRAEVLGEGGMVVHL